MRTWHFISVLFIILIELLCLKLDAQIPTDIPVLKPSNVTAYDINDGLPISCTYDGWIDEAGRLWINPCFGQEEHRTVSFYHFDGGESYTVNWENQPLDISGQPALQGMTDDGRMYGFFRNSAYFFFFDPESHEAEFHRLDDPSCHIGFMGISDSFGMVLYATTDTAHQVYTFLQGEVEFRISFARSSVYERMETWHFPQNHLLTGSELWLVDVASHQHWVEPDLIHEHASLLYRYELTTGRLTSYSTAKLFPNGYPPPAVKDDGRILQMVCLSEDNAGGLLLFMGPWGVHYRLDPDSGLTDYIGALPGFQCQGYYVNPFIQKDESGNVVFLQKDSNANYVAILRDRLGNHFDYSDVLNAAVDASRFQDGTITRLMGHDFTRQVFVFSSGGLGVVDLRLKGAISFVLPGSPTRGISELAPGRFVVVRERSQDLVFERSATNWLLESSLLNVNCYRGSFAEIEIYGDLVKDESGSLWFPVENNLIRMDESGNCEVFPAGFLFSKFMFVDRDKVVLVQSETNSIFLFDLASTKCIPLKIGGQQVILPDHVNDMMLAEDGTLWIASLRGLWHLDLKGGQIYSYGLEHGFRDERMMRLHQHMDGAIWIGTYSGGLHIFDPVEGVQKVIGLNEGLSNNTVIGILSDEEHYVWLSTYKGITLLSPGGKVITQLYREDGLSTNEFNRYSSYKASDGTLMFGSVAGINIIDPVIAKRQLIDEDYLRIYPTRITKYDPVSRADLIQTSVFDLSKPLRLSASRRFLQVDFALSSYIRPESQSFAYRITRKGEEGSTEWEYFGGRSKLDLPNLPAGKYDIEILGNDYRGNKTSEPLVIPVVAAEFFYKRAWFYLLCFVILAGIILLWIRKQHTERKKLELQLKQRTDEIMKARDQLVAQEKLASLGQLTAGIAHEIKNPLNFITNFAEGSKEIAKELDESIMATKDKIDSEQYALMKELVSDLSENAGIILENGLRTDGIIHNMMDLARGSEQEFTSVNLAQIVDQHAQLAYHGYRASNPSFQVELKTSFGDPALMIEVIPQDFGRVFLNILNNAFDALDQRKKSGDYFLPAIDIASENENGRVRISIRDNGTGIPEDMQKTIFHPFFTTKPTGSGNTGLGLSISYDIIRQHKGTMELKSEYGQYTEIILHLPVHQIKT